MAERQSEPRRAFPWRWLLIASLALNLAVAGIVLGAVVSGRASGPPRGFDLAIGPFARALGPEDRRSISHALARERPEPPPGYAGADAQMAAMIAAIRADPFDAAALAAGFDAFREKGERFQRHAEAALAARIAEMTPEERGAFADRLTEELNRPRRRDHD